MAVLRASAHSWKHQQWRTGRKQYIRQLQLWCPTELNCLLQIFPHLLLRNSGVINILRSCLVFLNTLCN